VSGRETSASCRTSWSRRCWSRRGTTLRLPEQAPFELPGAPALSALRSLEEVERQHILDVLESAGWKLEGNDGAAALLGLKPSTLRSRMQKLDIRRPSS
jgi:transcriptional regulator with GAF, ATPase, and Fis domain